MDVANDPEVIKLLTCDINDLSMQLATIANSPTSSSTSASDDDFETDVNSTPSKLRIAIVTCAF